MAEPTDKQIIIIAGPNGAGKTTFAQRFLTDDFAGAIDFLNADVIAAALCPEAPESVAIRAGRMMLAQISEQLEAGTNFALETTLSGRAYARAIPEWQSRGYTVTLFFLKLPNPETAVERVANRVRQGGHHIPENAIRRRFDSGWRNFNELYKPLVDCWAVYDSFQGPAQLLDRGFKS